MYSLLACLFAVLYSQYREWAFHYQSSRARLIGACEILCDYGVYTFLVPLFGIVYIAIQHFRHRDISRPWVADALFLFAAILTLSVITVWAAQDVPHVSLRGLS